MRLFTMTLAMAALAIAPAANAAVTATTLHGVNGGDLNGYLASSDLISGLIATELPGDTGWHPANPAAGNSLLPEGLPCFTNDSGESGLFGLLNDFPGAGTPAKKIQYDLAAPSDVKQIQILSGNDGGDGRVYSTTMISVSTDGGANFSPLGGYVPTLGTNSSGYYQSDPSGSLNPGTYRSTLQTIFDNTGAYLATGVTNIRFDFFAVDNGGGQSRDPFDGLNPYTGVDDGLTSAFVSPLIWEIDVMSVPEPSAAALLLLGLAGLVCRRR